MIIVVDNNSHIVKLAGVTDATSSMWNWCTKYVLSNYTVVSGVTLPLGYLDNCWTYISGTWAIASGMEDSVSALIGSSNSISSLATGDIVPSAGDPQTSLDVTIRSVANATSYELRYKSTGNYTSVTVLAAGTVKVTGLMPGTVYYFSLRVYDLSGVSEWTSDVSCATSGYAIPPVVTDLSLGEDWVNTDGLYIPTLGLVYSLPVGYADWDKALIQISIDGGLTFKDYGYDEFDGVGYLIVATGYFAVSDYVTVRVISVSKYGVQSPTGISPTITKQVNSQVISPPAPSGLRLESSPSPNSYVWNGLKFAVIWNASAQSTGGGTEQGAGGVPYDPHWAFDEFSLIINGVEELNQRMYVFRYEYIYGDGEAAFLDAKLLATQGTCTIRVRRWNIYNVASDWNAITITNLAPQAPANVTDFPFMYAAQFTWTPNAEPDFAYYYFRCKAGTGAWDAWARTTSPSCYRALTEAERTAYGDGAVIYVEVQAVDIFGNVSSTSSANAITDSLNMPATDIVDFSVTATKMFQKVIILDGDVWTNNSPSAGYIEWNSHTVVYNGVAYTIAAGNTNLTYVYWTGGTTYQTSNTNPALTDGQFMVATNVNGIHDLAWNAMANAVIGTAHIQNLAVKDAHIDTLSVAKLTAGVITSKAITMAIGAGTGDTKIQAGKTDFGDTTPGFIIGMDDSDGDKAKFEIGNATDYLKWDGTTFSIAGSLAIAGPPGADGTDGAPGPGLVRASSPPTSYLGGALPTGLLWYNTSSTDGGYDAYTMYQWNGSAWLISSIRGTYIDSNGIYTHEIVADKITSGTLSVGGTVTIAGDLVAVTYRTSSSTSVKRIDINYTTPGEMKFFANLGGGLEEAASIGINVLGGSYVVGSFGSLTSNNGHAGICGKSNYNVGVAGYTISGSYAVFGSTSGSGSGVYGESQSGSGIAGYGMGSASVGGLFYSSDATAGSAIRLYMSNSGTYSIAPTARWIPPVPGFYNFGTASGSLVVQILIGGTWYTTNGLGATYCDGTNVGVRNGSDTGDETVYWQRF